LISNDLNMVEDKIHYLPKLFVIPFYMVGVNLLKVILLLFLTKITNLNTPKIFAIL